MRPAAVSNSISVEENLIQQLNQQIRLRQKAHKPIAQPSLPLKSTSSQRIVDISEITHPYIDQAEPLSPISQLIVDLISGIAQTIGNYVIVNQKSTSVGTLNRHGK